MMLLTSFTIRTWDVSEIEFRRQPVLDSHAYVALYLVKPINVGLMGIQISNPMTSIEGTEKYWDTIERVATLVFGKNRGNGVNADKSDIHALSESIKRLMW